MSVTTYNGSKILITYNKNNELASTLIEEGILNPIDKVYFEELGVSIQFYEGKHHYFAVACYNGDCEEYIALKGFVNYNDFKNIVLYLVLEPLFYEMTYIIDDYLDYYDEFHNPEYLMVAEKYKRLQNFIESMKKQTLVNSKFGEEAWKEGADEIIEIQWKK